MVGGWFLLGFGNCRERKCYGNDGEEVGDRRRRRCSGSNRVKCPTKTKQ